ncbi:MAG: glycoside hydrolase family 43 protein, partial [Blautia sp.]|nr:glycoside hydrolase family 43 protein [Blautia sp.]
YPDPTIIRVEDDFYLAASSFELCPGIPIFHSKDLVHWTQICNAITQENGLHMEKNAGNGGIMAPTLRYHNGTYYIINANFSDKGNYIITAKDPAGPWSEPHWLTDVPGIDASIFFDNDGKCYLMGTGEVWKNEGGRMERGIWLAEYDIENYRMAGKPVTIFNSALRGGLDPEAPHLYHVGDYYYLIIAEGGTDQFHAVMVARSKELFGFYENCPANPVLSHRQMGWNAPIINVGHADLVELKDGSWYAVFLASRLIDGYHKNLGRETFICPVKWERDWPLFTPETGIVQWEYEAPASLTPVDTEPEAVFDDFDDEKLPLYWVHWGTPYTKYYQVRDSALELRCIPQKMVDDIRQVSFEANLSYDKFAPFIGRRQRAMNTVVTAQMQFVPNGTETAGIAIQQAMNHQLHVERAVADGKQVLRLVEYTSEFNHPNYIPGFVSETFSRVLAEVPYDKEQVVLQFDIQRQDITVNYGENKDALTVLGKADGGILNPEKVGGMVGTVIGMYASGNGVDSNNCARFDWFEMR